jgi:hypothetical protein
MFNFGVELADRSLAPVVGLDDVTLRPLSWSGEASGGPKAAEVEATGSRAALKSALLNWLRYGVTITTPAGAACWWGYVHEVALTIDGVQIVSSMDRLRNRIAITYTSLEGAVESALTTAWAEDASSQSAYGILEHLESLGQASTAMATTYRDKLLARDAWPRLTRSLGQGGNLRAILRCRGWTTPLSRRYYLRTDGRLENMPNDTLVQPIGWGVAASDQIGFGDNAIHDAWGRFADMAAGMKLTVSGATGSGNNKTYTIQDAPAQVGEYTNNTIYFQPTDDIFDTAAGMGMVKSEHWLLVTGSPANSRWHLVGSAGADHVRTSAGVSGAITAEGTGRTIGLYLAQRLGVTEATAYAAPGASNVTINHHGQQVAQRLTLGTAMKVDRVMVEAAKVGAPGGDFVVRIHADSAGAIGALLTSGSLPASSLTEDLAAVWVPVTGITLAAGSYWIVARRADANNGQNYYKVGMTAEAYDTCQMWTGSAWVSHAPGWRLKFRLWAVEDTGLMAETMLAATIQGVTLSGGFVSGVNGFPAMDSRAVVLDELTRLLGVGTASGARALASVTPDLVLRLVAQETASQERMLTLRTAGGKLALYDAAGSPWPPGVLPAGMWVELADVDSDLTAVGGLSPAYVEEATYNAESNSWEIAFEGERSLADLLRVQAG